MGSFMDKVIPSWVQTPDGVLYDFEGIAPGPRPGMVDTALLRTDELCIAPGLLYRLRK